MRGGRPLSRLPRHFSRSIGGACIMHATEQAREPGGCGGLLTRREFEIFLLSSFFSSFFLSFFFSLSLQRKKEEEEEGGHFHGRLRNRNVRTSNKNNSLSFSRSNTFISLFFPLLLFSLRFLKYPKDKTLLSDCAETTSNLFDTIEEIYITKT